MSDMFPKPESDRERKIREKKLRKARAELVEEKPAPTEPEVRKYEGAVVRIYALPDKSGDREDNAYNKLSPLAKLDPMLSIGDFVFPSISHYVLAVQLSKLSSIFQLLDLPPAEVGAGMRLAYPLLLKNPKEPPTINNFKSVSDLSQLYEEEYQKTHNQILRSNATQALNSKC